MLSLALGSQALTLGRIRGAALIGKPLDVTVQVQLDASESASSLCFEADVFHADTRQETSRVRVLVEGSAQAQSVNVRILSSALVDEPMVTVYLRSGCSQKTSRRYVLLADMPSEVAAPAVLAVPSATPLASPAPLVRRVVPVETPKPAPPTDKPANRPVNNRAEAAPKSVTASAPRKAARPSAQPRLKLDLLELMAEREPTLNFSTELLTQPSGNPQRRSEAAALWLAVNASPEDILHQGVRMRTLETDVNALKTLTAKNQLGLTDLGARLHRAESERFSAWVVYALVASLLGSLAALAFIWNRRRRGPAHDNDWRNGAGSQQPLATEPWPTSALGSVPQPLTPPPALKKSPAPVAAGSWKKPEASSDMDISMAEVSHSIFDELMRADASHTSENLKPAAPAPRMATPEGPGQQKRSVNALTLLRQEQVELLLAQGRPEPAVGFLKQHLRDSGRPNPALYLDLLSLLHSLSLKSDFQHYREEFGRFFTGRVPEFAVFKNEGRGLDDYPHLLARITELWATPAVLELLESCIVQDSAGGKHESIDLAAFREVLLLHAVAQLINLAPTAVSGEPVHLPLTQPTPPTLDLDLSDLDLGPLVFEPEATADVDIPLSMPDEPVLDAPTAALAPPPRHENMIDFDPPEASKSGQRHGL
ncbi:MAG: hypothetical protein GZ093_15655 [Rhodoferax sp.]|uniref:type IV pilus assembly protein FimV n=1 Tax=Rhodoferax sp. TaxID=50421 RepID=UPI0013FFE1F8|nr:hypothetical protein [Rhodoferax sp.]NDP40157.1 hypothetical protein [Rhodoferax sp.]